MLLAEPLFLREQRSAIWEGAALMFFKPFGTTCVITQHGIVVFKIDEGQICLSVSRVFRINPS